MENSKVEKKRAVTELAVCVGVMAALTILMAVFGAGYGLLAGVLAYWIPCAVLLFYVLKVEKQSLSYLGLKFVCARHIWEGIGLFIVQQIPLLLMKMDYSVYAMAPDPVYMVVMLLYCFVCVGFAEELIFRSFLLKKTQDIFSQRWICVAINILLFYLFFSFLTFLYSPNK